MDTQLNDFIGVSNQQNINYNKDVTMTDLEGNMKIIVKCYCTIVAGKSISYSMDVFEKAVFEKYKELIQSEIDKFKEETKTIAKAHNVPVI